MGRDRRPATLKMWRGKWYIFATDYRRRTPVDRRYSCTAHGAYDAPSRQRLMQRFRKEEILGRAEAIKLGGSISYDAKLIDEVADYLEDVEQRVAVREANTRARSGLSPHTGQIIAVSMGYFNAWLREASHERLETGQLSPHHLRRFLDHLALEPTRHGQRQVQRSGATINHHARHLRTLINWIARRRPRRFPDVEDLRYALKPQPVEPREEVACTPDELVAFYEMAEQRENPERPMEVARLARGRWQNFKQRPPILAATPVSRLFLLLAITGARRSEGLAMKWSDIDLAKGRIRILSQKTGRMRMLPLIGAPEAELGPKFLQLLRLWKLQAGGREYVLPHRDLDQPAFPKLPWEATTKAYKGRRISPQQLRRNACSYLASLGVPAAVAALWLGHSTVVAEKHYHLQVLERHDGTLEQAMGLDVIIDRLIRQATTREALA